MRGFTKKCFRFGIRKLRNFMEIVRYYFIFPIAIIMYHNKEIYLISERGHDARDNGFYMFEYIRKNAPSFDVYYVIDRLSPDYDKVKKLGNVIEPKTLKHYLLFIGAKYKISTHIMGYAPDMLFYISFNKKHKVPGKQIFLQHGVIKDNIEGLYYRNTRADIFVCGAEPEYFFVKQHFNYNERQVVYTGLARYDGLFDFKTKRQILVMPTWRVFMKDVDPDRFRKSEYFRNWNHVLNDSKLLACLKKSNIDLVFYPHYEMQPYVKEFMSRSSNVIIADFEHYDVQKLLKESMLLITDYSSVFFDFAYMMKPCLYYQFDEELFFAQHYSRGYFNYRKMGFGKVATEHEELIAYTIELIESNMEMEEEYRKRAYDFFPIHDNHNCERILKKIEEIK